MSAGKKLAANVYVDGVLYTPESDVPAEVAKRITNPKAWGDEPDVEGESVTRSPAKKTAAKKAPSGSSDN